MASSMWAARWQARPQGEEPFLPLRGLWKRPCRGETAATKNQNGEHYAQEINVQETKQAYHVYEKNNHPGSEMWRNIGRYLGYRTRLSKSDPRLFESPEALYADLINRLEATHRSHLESAAKVAAEIERIKTQLKVDDDQ